MTLVTLVSHAFAHIAHGYANPISNGVIDYSWTGAQLDPAPPWKENFEH